MLTLVKTSLFRQFHYYEDGFSVRLQKTSSRRLDQDEYIHLSHSSSEDVFKTSWSRPIYSSWLYVFKTSSRRFQDVFKTSSRRFQDVFKTSCKNVFKTSSRRLAKTFSRSFQNVFKTSCKNVFKTSFKDVFKTFSRRIIELICSW